MIHWIWLILAFFGGGLFGVFLMAITIASHTKD